MWMIERNKHFHLNYETMRLVILIQNFIACVQVEPVDCRGNSLITLYMSMPAYFNMNGDKSHVIDEFANIKGQERSIYTLILVSSMYT